VNIVVDANVMVAALIQHGIVRELILGHPGAFLTPETCLTEVWENRSDWNRREVPDDQVRRAIDALTADFITVLPRSTYRDMETEASTLISDPDDVPVVALALAIDNQGVWTFNTRDFLTPRLQTRIRVLGTTDVKGILSEP